MLGLASGDDVGGSGVAIGSCTEDLEGVAASGAGRRTGTGDSEAEMAGRGWL